MFHWIRVITKFPHHNESAPAIDQLAQLTAERSMAAVRERLTLDCTTLCATELRGYVRARAWSIVRQQTDKLCAERNLSADFAATLMSRAMDRTAHAVARQRPRKQVTSLPTPHVQLRIAG
jgi:hypothetical protein